MPRSRQGVPTRHEKGGWHAAASRTPTCKSDDRVLGSPRPRAFKTLESSHFCRTTRAKEFTFMSLSVHCFVERERTELGRCGTIRSS